MALRLLNDEGKKPLRLLNSQEESQPNWIIEGIKNTVKDITALPFRAVGVRAPAEGAVFENTPSVAEWLSEPVGTRKTKIPDRTVTPFTPQEEIQWKQEDVPISRGEVLTEAGINVAALGLMGKYAFDELRNVIQTPQVQKKISDVVTSVRGLMWRAQKAAGMNPPSSLVPQGEEEIRKAVESGVISFKDALRISPSSKQAEIAKRSVGMEASPELEARIAEQAPKQAIKPSLRLLQPQDELQPAAGGLPAKMPSQVSKWLEKGVTIAERQAPIKITDPEAKIKDLSGQVVDLPTNHEMTPYKLSNGKIWLHDGKNVVVDSGQLQNLKNRNLVLGEKQPTDKGKIDIESQAQQAVAEGKSLEEFISSQFDKPTYGMTHRPTYEGMPSAHNLLEGDAIPRDVYEHPEFSIASGRNLKTDKAAQESWKVLQEIRDNPEADVTLYRATRKNELNSGDWVTFSKTYAEDSVEPNTPEKVYSFKVKAKDVVFAGDDINEFGYYPKSQLTSAYDKAKLSQPMAGGLAQEPPPPQKPTAEGAAPQEEPQEPKSPLQKRIEAMTDRIEKINYAKMQLAEGGKIKESLKGRIRSFQDEFMREELHGLPSIYKTKEGGVDINEAIQELSNEGLGQFENEEQLIEYLRNWEDEEKYLKKVIEENKPKFLTQKETTILKEQEKVEKFALKQGAREATKNAKLAFKEEKAAIIESLKNKAENIVSIKKSILDFAKEALPTNVRGKALSMVARSKTSRDLAEAFSRIDEWSEDVRRKDLIGDIKATGAKAVDTSSIAVDYKRKIKELLEKVDFVNRREDTITSLKSTMEFIRQAKSQGQDVTMPREILEKLTILSRKPTSELTLKELGVFKDDIDLLVQLGETKLNAIGALYEAKKNTIMKELMAGTKNLDKHLPIREGLEPLSISDQIKNILRRGLNEAQRIDLAITPWDVIFDELDGGAGRYDGSNYRLIKSKTDLNFSSFLDLFDKNMKPIDNLVKELNLTPYQYKRIGIYGAKVQEGGFEKLLNSGFTQEEIDAVKLDPKEQKLYDAIRETFDSLHPKVVDFMRVNYNEEVGKVRNYFSFMTDFDSMDEAEIFQRFGVEAPEFGTKPSKTIQRGFTKERVGGGQKIKLNAYEIARKHIEDVSYLLTMQADNKMLFEIANTPEYKEAAGARGQRLSLEFLDLISKKGGIGTSSRITLVDILRRNVGLGTLALKISSALIQPSSIIDAGVYIGGYNLKGAYSIATDNNAWVMVSKFPEIRHRIGDDPAFREISAFNKWREKGMAPLVILDKISAMSTAMGAYMKKMNELGLPIDYQNINQEAMDYAQFVVRRTQSSGLFKDATPAATRGELTGNVSIDKMLLQFQNFMLNRWSVIRHDLWRQGIRDKNPISAIGRFTWILLSILVSSGIGFGIRKSRNAILNKKDESKFMGSLLQEFGQTVPFLGSVMFSALYGSVPVPAVKAVSGVFEDVSYLKRSKKSAAKQRATLRLLADTAQVLGLPGAAEARSWIPPSRRGQSTKKLRLLN